MKRGLIAWDPRELAPETLHGRVAQAQALLAAHGLDAAVAYTSVAQPQVVRYLTHFLPYWNEGMLVLPREGEPLLFVALSNRVFPWIQGSSTLTQIRASRNLGGDAGQYLREQGARRVGLIDRGSIPYRAIAELEQAFGAAGVVDLPALTAAMHLGADADERRLRARASTLAADALASLGATVDGRDDRHLAGHLDRALRLAGAEDTLVLVGPAGQWPGFPRGAALGDRAHVVVQAEYKGHWVHVGRTLGLPAAAAAGWPARLASYCAPGTLVRDAVAAARAHDGSALYLYRGAYGAPFAALGDADRLAVGDIVAAVALRTADGGELWGETFAVETERAVGF